MKAGELVGDRPGGSGSVIGNSTAGSNTWPVNRRPSPRRGLVHIHRCRFPGRGHCAACYGTAPIEASLRTTEDLPAVRRGNRRLNHAIHLAAVTQIRQRHSAGRAYFDKKVAERKTRKQALRALKRRISDAIFARLQADTRAGRTPR